MKYGFENEYWLVDDIIDNGFDTQPGKFFMVPDGVPKDECGYLAEVRGDPHEDPYKAAALFDVELRRVNKLVEEKNLFLWSSGSIKLPKKFLWEAMRLHGKPSYPQSRGNLYGLDYKPGDTWSRAGLHIHFSDQYADKEGKLHCRMIDMVKIIRHLDKVFAKQIKDAARLPGFYEMKHHGFEYRSLPCNIDLIDVCKALKEIK